MSKSYRRIAAVGTTCEILRYLSRQPHPVGGAVVSEGVGAPHGTVMCHLSTLEDHGLVRSIGDGWELGPALSLYWAAYKAKLEGKIARAHQELDALTV